MSDAPLKKSKKVETSTPLEQNAAAVSKKNRKRAADFMKDDESDGGAGLPSTTAEATNPSKKKKKDRKGAKTEETLTADGVNGVVEHKSSENVEVTTKASKKATSMQQEAQNTVDKEIQDEFEAFSDEDEQRITVDQPSDAEDAEVDTAAALLTGFDSDSDDAAEDKGDLTTTPGLPNYKKTSKKLRKAKESASSDEPGTVYVGRIPHGFYEPQMRAFFTQFGDITRLRLARNKRTAASKHFAFIEFASSEVAKIAAEAMDNYLMFGHILKCKYAPSDTLHADVFKGANKKYRKIPHQKLEAQKLAEPKSVEKWQKKNKREQQKRDKKAKLLKDKMDYTMPVKPLIDPATVVQKQLDSPTPSKNTIDAAADRQLRIENGDTPAVKKAATTEATAEEPAVPIAKKEKPSKKDKKDKMEKKETERKEKYVAPTHKKQAEKAEFAKENPEEHKQMKKDKEAERVQERTEKKAAKSDKAKAKKNARKSEAAEAKEAAEA